MGAPPCRGTVSAVTRRQARHLGLACFTGLVCTAAYAAVPASAASFKPLSLGLAYASLGLLLLTLVIGPWMVIRAGRMPVNTMFRRDVGIWAAMTGCLHVVFGLQSHYGGRIARFFFLDRPTWTPDLSLHGVSNWAGAAASLIIVVLLLLSNNVALRALGAPAWKFLQRFAYPLAVLTVVHTFGYQLVEGRNPAASILTAMAVAVVLVLQGLGLVRTRQQAASDQPVPRRG